MFLCIFLLLALSLKKTYGLPLSTCDLIIESQIVLGLTGVPKPNSTALLYSSLNSLPQVSCNGFKPAFLISFGQNKYQSSLLVSFSINKSLTTTDVKRSRVLNCSSPIGKVNSRKSIISRCHNDRYKAQLPERLPCL